MDNRKTIDHWTEEEKNYVIYLKRLNPDMNSTVISKLLNENLETNYYRSPAAVRNLISRSLKNINENEKSDEGQEKIYEEEVEERYQESFNRMEDMRRETLDSMSIWYQNIGKPKKEPFTKIVSISDLHIPFHNTGVLSDMLSKHSDADILVINGDFLELYSVSSWPKNKSLMLKHEYQIGMKMLKTLSSIFPKVILTKGNHEDRLQRYFSSNVDQNVSFMTDPDILHRMSEGYDFEGAVLTPKENFKNITYKKSALSWYAKIGKCIFAHPSGSSGIPMRTAIKTAEYFLSRGIDFEAVICGHTHKMGKLIWNNKILIEQGCCCIPLEYESTSKMAYAPQAFGYAVAYIDKNGNVDFDKTNPVYFGTGSMLNPNEEI